MKKPSWAINILIFVGIISSFWAYNELLPGGDSKVVSNLVGDAERRDRARKLAAARRNAQIEQNKGESEEQREEINPEKKHQVRGGISSLVGEIRKVRKLAERANRKAQEKRQDAVKIQETPPLKILGMASDAYRRKDYKSALREIKPLAEQGNFFAQFNLGLMYENGDGVPKDDKTAAKWYKLAADQGYAPAQYNLGGMYIEGRGVPQNFKTAVKWCRLAAEQGHAFAQYNLGVMYDKGKGLPQDDKTAVKWYRLAAEQGDADSQFNLGQMYLNGRGVSQNHKNAVKWYTPAAEQGHTFAQYNLGWMYYQGQGVPQDNVYAYMWLTIAVSSGESEMALKNRDIIAKKMTSSQIAEARNLIRKCNQQNFKDC